MFFYWFKKIIIIVLVLVVILGALLFLLAQKETPKEVHYGASFNIVYANELGLDWKQTYNAILDDLKVRHLRLAAHWNIVEPREDEFNFTELDYQLSRAKEVKADVVLAVGRRLPRWPECHIPDWAKEQDWATQKNEIKDYLTKVVTRYKNNPAIVYWQVENEPYLNVFANEHCGDLDEEFLQEEIALVKELDPTRPILVTDSGNLGTWYKPYSNGDAFGTSVYVYFWNPTVGPFKTVMPAWLYRVKENLVQLFYSDKPTFLIELSAEPWLLHPVKEVPLETQLERMNLDKVKEIVAYAKDTRYEEQYLWGLEWWYWLKLQGETDVWDYGKTLFDQTEAATDVPVGGGQNIASEPIPLKDVPLSDTQKSLLDKAGIDTNTFVITPEMVQCAEKAVGKDRLDAIVAGDKPGVLEAVKLAACAR